MNILAKKKWLRSVGFTQELMEMKRKGNHSKAPISPHFPSQILSHHVTNSSLSPLPAASVDATPSSESPDSVPTRLSLWFFSPLGLNTPCHLYSALQGGKRLPQDATWMAMEIQFCPRGDAEVVLQVVLIRQQALPFEYIEHFFTTVLSVWILSWSCLPAF